MRKLVVTEFLTLDGIFEDPGGAEGTTFGGWNLKFGGPDFGKFKFDELLAADIQLLGRKTYEGFAKAWPKAEGTGEFGERMNSMPKYVVSSTLTQLDWQNSHLLEGDLVTGVTKLKQGSGGDILVAGSGTLVHGLMEHGLVDEYHLLINPIVLGEGRRLFEGATPETLKLKDSITLQSGSVMLIYEPAPKK